MTLTDDERALLTSLLDLASAKANVKSVAERAGLKVKAAQAALEGLRESAKPKVPSKRGAKTKLTDDVRATILDAIRAGSFYHVACKAAGIDAETLRRWMASDAPVHRVFRGEVEAAKATARQAKEADVFKTDSLAWLRLGPGRDRGEGDEGWTDPAQRHEHKHSGDKDAPLKIEYVNDWKPALVVEDVVIAPEAAKRNGANGSSH